MIAHRILSTFLPFPDLSLTFTISISLSPFLLPIWLILHWKKQIKKKKQWHLVITILLCQGFHESEIHRVPRKDIVTLVYHARNLHCRLQLKGDALTRTWLMQTLILPHCWWLDGLLLAIEIKVPPKRAQRPLWRWIHCRECGVKWQRRATATSQEEVVLGLLWEIIVCRIIFFHFSAMPLFLLQESCSFPLPFLVPVPLLSEGSSLTLLVSYSPLTFNLIFTTQWFQK